MDPYRLSFNLFIFHSHWHMKQHCTEENTSKRIDPLISFLNKNCESVNGHPTWFQTISLPNFCSLEIYSIVWWEWLNGTNFIDIISDRKLSQREREKKSNEQNKKRLIRWTPFWKLTIKYFRLTILVCLQVCENFARKTLEIQWQSDSNINSKLVVCFFYLFVWQNTNERTRT